MSSSEFPFGNLGPVGRIGNFGDLGGGGGGGGLPPRDPREFMAELAQRLEHELNMGQSLRRVLDESGATFTPGAYLMLLIPLYEHKQATSGGASILDIAGGLGFHRSAELESFTKLVKQAKDDPATFDRSLRHKATINFTFEKVVTSLSMIKAYWKKFCDIPPFCSETQ